jgi:hypothetical protein
MHKLQQQKYCFIVLFVITKYDSLLQMHKIKRLNFKNNNEIIQITSILIIKTDS